MKLLALDTSSDACSVALTIDGRVTEEHVVKPREHTRILMVMISNVLENAGVALDGLDALVLGNGPGSFIGMRIGASVAQGLSYGAGLSIVPVSSLAAIAAEVFATGPANRVVVAQDAHMGQVYCGCFDRDDNDLPVLLGVERIVGSDCLLDDTGPVTAAGAGWQRYPDLVAVNHDLVDSVANVLHPRARHLLAIGEEGFGQGCAVSPQSLVPAYLRTKVAELPSKST